MRRQVNSGFSIDLPVLLGSLAAGVAAWVVGAVLYAVLIEKIPNVLLVAIEFLLLYVMLAAVVSIINAVRGNFEDDVLFADSTGKIILVLLVGGILVCGLSALFQWIYGLNSKKENHSPTSYIFVIDDSGSMQESDPDGLRYQAISEVLEGMPEDFPYMIYSFADEVQLVREMRPVSEGIGDIPVNSYGGTSIRAALNQVYSDYENGVWADEARPKVILLTDGYATDIGWFRPIGKILKKFAKAHINISTVGLGQVDDDLMNQIADRTDGIFLNVSDAALLKDAMTDAATQYSDVRNLLSARSTTEHDILYALLRIVFLTLLGTLINFLMVFAVTREDDALLIGIVGAVKSLLGSILMELCVQSVGIPAVIMWLILWILIAVLFCRQDEGERRRRRPARGSSRNLSRR